jgi:hypothetical protein
VKCCNATAMLQCTRTVGLKNSVIDPQDRIIKLLHDARRGDFAVFPMPRKPKEPCVNQRAEAIRRVYSSESHQQQITRVQCYVDGPSKRGSILVAIKRTPKVNEAIIDRDILRLISRPSDMPCV